MGHRRYGHLGAQGLKQFAIQVMVNGFDCDFSKNVRFCEPCTKGIVGYGTEVKGYRLYDPERCCTVEM